MICKWLSVAVAVAGFCGCTGPPPAKPAEKARPEIAAQRTTDDFGLPLVIVIDVPPTPPEISRPSPPIREEPRHPKGSWFGD